jgi:hypothetical protein
MDSRLATLSRPGMTAEPVARMERSEIRGRWAGSRKIPGFRCAQPGLRKHHRSREAFALRGLLFPSSRNEGSGAPDGALGACEAPVERASDVGPQALARRLTSLAIGTSASRRSTAAIVGSGPALAKPSGVAQRGGALQSRIGAFARSARSGGRAVLPGASRGAVTSRARRTPHPAPPQARLRRRPR